MPHLFPSIRVLLTALLLMSGVVTRLRAQPTITAINPAANTRAASQTSVVSISFSQPLTASSAQGLKVYSAQHGGLLTSRSSAVVQGTMLSFSPGSGGFRPGETIYGSVTRSVASTSGPLARARVTQFTTAVGGSGQGNFQLGTVIPVGTAPENVTVADVDGDGDLDLLTANTGSDNVSVSFNDGLGTYSGRRNVAVGRGPTSIVAGDVDGDGDLDLLTTNYGSNNVSVRLNNGLGDFSGSQTVTVGSGAPQGLALGDVDGDGDLDLAVANQIGNSVSIRLNGGDATGSNTGVFSGSQDVLQLGGSFAIALHDVDGDGDLDVLVSSLTSNIVRVLLNGGDATGSGTGLFSLGSTVTVGSNPASLAVGDVDADGDLDLLTANYGNSNVSVRLNNGLGVFSGTYTVAVGPSPHGVVLGDVDADGDLDLLTANDGTGTGANTVSVRLNGGNASGSSSGLFSAGQTVTVGARPRGLAVGDLDSDGDLDLLVTSATFNSVTMRLNQPTVVPAPRITGFSPASAAIGATVTVTGSGLRGITSLIVHGTVVPPTNISSNSDTSFRFVVPTAAATGTVILTTAAGRATSTGFTILVPALVRITTTTPGVNAVNAPRAESAVTITFTEPVTTASAQLISIHSAQSGGKKAGTVSVTGTTARYTSSLPGKRGEFQPGEVVQVSVPATVQGASGLTAAKYVYEFTAAVGGTGRGVFLPGSDIVNTDASFPIDGVVGDMDADGDLDLVTVNANSGAFDSWLNDGTGTFTRSQSVSTNARLSRLITADLDRDGDLDLLGTYLQEGKFSLWLNNGQGVFGPVQELNSGSRTTREVKVADVDGDADLDLLALNSIDNTVSVFFNDGNARFSNIRYANVAASSVYTAVGDVDADGDVDLLVTSYDESIRVHLNDGNGTFVSSQTVPFRGFPRSLALGDMDGDGDLDMLSVNEEIISVFINDGAGIFGAPQQVPASGLPLDVVPADLDSDGDLDLLVINNQPRSLNAHFNNGTGVFSGVRSVSSGYTPGTIGGPQKPLVGDIDGDGDLDALVLNTGNNNLVTVLRNEGTGPLATRSASTRLGFTLAPNPASGTVRLLGSVRGTQIQLLDAVGRLRQTVPAAQGETLLSLHGLSAGLYFVRIGQEVARLTVE